MPVSESLPYQLSIGVTATEHGLVFDGENAPVLESLVMDWPGSKSGMFGTIIPWVTVAERLRYRVGQPWAMENRIARTRFEGSIYNWIVCGDHSGSEVAPYALHRLAAILCDDAAAFRILYACIREHLEW